MEALGLIDRDIWGVDPFFHTAAKLLNKPSAGGIKVDLIEHTDHFDIKADMPGFTKENVNVDYDSRRDTLTISVQQTTESDVAHDIPGLMHFKERSEIKSSRIIPFKHGSVDPGQIVAKYENGVLTVKLNKRVETDHEDENLSIKIN